MNKPFKTIYLDADGVLVDFMNPAIKRLNKIHNARVTVADVQRQGHSLATLWGLTTREFEEEFRDDEFWENLPIYAWTPALVYWALKNADEVKILTRPMDNFTDAIRHARYQSFYNRLGLQTIFSVRKSVYASSRVLLIDDLPENVDSFRAAGGHAVLWPAEWHLKGVGLSQRQYPKAFIEALVADAISKAKQGNQSSPAQSQPHPIASQKPASAWLSAAIAATSGDRQRDYGHPHENFTKIAQAWSIIFGVEVSIAQVAQAMIMMKVCRDLNTHKDDNWVDIVGYALAYEQAKQKEDSQ